MVTGILGELGLWLGSTVPGGDLSNPKGFFESFALREKVNKKILTEIGCDPLGVRKLPELHSLPSVKGLRDYIAKLLHADHYDGKSPWGFKDAKLTLLWPIWRETFPDAQWLIVSRPRELVVRSCLKTQFMRQHSVQAAFWERFCDQYDERLAVLREDVSSVMEIDASQLVAGNFTDLMKVAKRMGLAWDSDRVSDFIDPAFWGDRNPGTAMDKG